MTSDLQVAANRQNALNSTGPRTLGAKHRTRNIAVTHGIYSRQLLITGEDPEELAALQSDVRNELAPKGAFEEILASQIVGDFWRLRRLDLAEQAYLEDSREACFKSMARSLSPDELSQYAANHPDPVRLRSAFRYDTSPDWEDFAPLDLRKTPQDILPAPTTAEFKAAIDRRVDRAENLGVTFLKAVAPVGGRHPMDEIDRLRRALTRDIIQKRAALDRLKERRTVIEAE